MDEVMRHDWMAKNHLFIRVIPLYSYLIVTHTCVTRSRIIHKMKDIIVENPANAK